MRNLIICGSFYDGDGIESPVYCDPKTGDLAVNLGLRGNCVIGNVSVNDPVNMDGVSLRNFYEATGAQGIVVTASYLLAFKDGIVEYRKSLSPMQVDYTLPYDTDVDYDGELE